MNGGRNGQGAAGKTAVGRVPWGISSTSLRREFEIVGRLTHLLPRAPCRTSAGGAGWPMKRPFIRKTSNEMYTVNPGALREGILTALGLTPRGRCLG